MRSSTYGGTAHPVCGKYTSVNAVYDPREVSGFLIRVRSMQVYSDSKLRRFSLRQYLPLEEDHDGVDLGRDNKLTRKELGDDIVKHP